MEYGNYIPFTLFGSVYHGFAALVHGFAALSLPD